MTKTLIVKYDALDVPWVDPPHVSAEQATKEKGFPHPGSDLILPNNLSLPIQYGANPTQTRNGLLLVEVVQAVIENLGVYQTPDNPMRSRETALAIMHLEQAIHWLQHRQLDRQQRGVRFVDKA